MFFAVALFALAPLLLLTAPVHGYRFVNTATGLLIQDHNVTHHDILANPIVGAPYNETRPKAQSGWLFFGNSFDALALGKTRLINGTTTPIKTHVAGLPGDGLTAQDFGSVFKLVQPVAGAPELFAFIAYLFGPTPLAVTAAGPFEQLTLQPYHSSDSKQHWLIYPEATPTSTTAGSQPGKILGKPITNPGLTGASIAA